jgi:hypothetical protein
MPPKCFYLSTNPRSIVADPPIILYRTTVFIRRWKYVITSLTITKLKQSVLVPPRNSSVHESHAFYKAHFHRIHISSLLHQPLQSNSIYSYMFRLPIVAIIRT